MRGRSMGRRHLRDKGASKDVSYRICRHSACRVPLAAGGRQEQCRSREDRTTCWRMTIHAQSPCHAERHFVYVGLLLVLLASHARAQTADRLTFRQYYFCLGGDMEGFACQGLADVTTCGEGSKCIEDLYVDACGNGYRMQLEECDDGNTVTGDGCSANCTVEVGWLCAGATDREPDTCSVVCGDGRQLSDGCCDDEDCSQECSQIWGCDDGNLEDNDGCSKTCSVESGYKCWRGDIDDYSPCLCARERVSAASGHTCVIDSNAKLKCWGDDKNNKTVTYFDPYDGAYAWPRGSWQHQDVFVAVSSGAEHNCATKFSGEIICWGWRGPGGIGDGRLFMPPAPDWERNSGGGLLWGQISLGFASSCGLLHEKRFQYRPVCSDGQTAGEGCPNREMCGAQCREEGDWSTHWLVRHPCFLSYVDAYTCTYPANRTIVCWGEDSYKQIQMPVADTWVELSSGDFHSCGVLENGTARCWGNNNYGQATVPARARKWMQVRR